VSKNSILILIPARYQSSRFLGKPLCPLLGTSMIHRVLKNMQFQSNDFETDAYVVTDDERIENHVKEISDKVIRVDDDVNSGTLRIELAFRRKFLDLKKYDLIINVQGDEPLLTKDDLIPLIKYHLNAKVDIATMVKRYGEFSGDFFDHNKVKVVMNEKSGEVYYFSRAPIPFKRDVKDETFENYWFHHIGVYSYRPNALLQFAKLDESRLENLEKLEQLRALENGFKFGAIETKATLIGVDSPEDVKRVEEQLKKTIKE